ncbi:hypothetical protein Q4E93_22855 [Flavitalea sp. BT771]|uniref:hypothetical protein n=1 Tax=Flavitalea sp. BT771 TaxID=3063329 RepID=UPI0026E2BB37|nr:hypothetical protein [Flavitalea sp. BT771]MDO6433471.1 hypothetical protein [Flavitalea sp. BT771]MDV6222624.1 hypothetical protein [Flavitalea sp. BT771]
MQTDFITGELSRWISNFNDNKALPFVTTSALIKLEDLEKFVAEIKKQQADSVRIYFLRLQTGETLPALALPLALPAGDIPKGCKWHEASSAFTQATIAMVPAKNFTIESDLTFAADDIVLNNMITTLMPGIPEKGTGLNPPSPTKAVTMVGTK